MYTNTSHKESERRLVTILFADISGFTTISENADPEEITHLINRCFSIMEQVIEKYDGTVDKFIGDCAMALFGAPQALENAPLNAVNAALDIRSELYAFNLQERLLNPLNVHIGINTGIVLAGMVGGQNNKSYTVIGETVNLAARLENAAQAGQILIGQNTYHAARDIFKFRYIKAMNIKGISKPVPIYELLSQKSKMERLPRQYNTPIQSELVGREKEIIRLENSIVNVLSGKGGIIHLVGEAGIGKTRLLEEVKRSAIANHVSLLEGKSISIGRNFSYFPLIDLLQNWAGITESQTESESLQKLKRLLWDICPGDLEDILPFCATLMGIKLQDPYKKRISDIKDESLEKLITNNLRLLLQRYAEKRPIVIVLEDLHWADDSSLEMLEKLYYVVESSPILFISVFRPVYDIVSSRITAATQKRFKPYFTQIDLKPLSAKSVTRLLQNLMDATRLPSKVKNRIIERASGNPFFVEEVFRSLVDSGAVVYKSGHYRIVDNVTVADVPHTILGVLMARIDRLDAQTRDVVRTASVIGKRFFHRLLTEVAQKVEHVDQRLGYLKKIQLIIEQPDQSEVTYFFKHALAQEAAYNSLLHQQKKELHLKIAHVISRLFQSRLNEFYGMLAYHYSMGGDYGKAEEFMLKAGEEAMKSAASNEALHYYREALSIYRLRHKDQSDANKIADMENNIALSLFNHGQLSEAMEYFRRVLAFHGIHFPKTPLAISIKLLSALCHVFIAVTFPHLKWNQHPTSKDKRMLILAHKRLQALSITDLHQFFFETVYFIKMISAFKLDEIENGVGLLLDVSPSLSWSGKSLDLSRKVTAFARDKIDWTNPRMVLCYELSQLSPNLFEGRWDSEYNPALVDKNIMLGEIYRASVYVTFHCRIKIEQGKYDEAAALIEKLSETGYDYAHEFPAAMKYVLNSKLLMKFGHLKEALLESERGIDFISKTNLHQQHFAQLCFKARIHDFLKQPTAAQNTLDNAKRHKQSTHFFPEYLGNYAISTFHHGLIQLENGLTRSQSHAIRIQKKKLRRQIRTMLHYAGKIASDRTEIYRLVGTFHWLCGTPQKALEWWQKSIAEGEKIGTVIEVENTSKEITHRVNESNHAYNPVDERRFDTYRNIAKQLIEKVRVWSDERH